MHGVAFHCVDIPIHVPEAIVADEEMYSLLVFVCFLNE